MGPLRTGLSGYEITVAVRNDAIAEIVDVQFPNFGLTQKGSVPAKTVAIKVSDLNDVLRPQSGSGLVATVMLRGKGGGTTTLDIGVTTLDDDFGQPIVAQVQFGTVSVSGETVCPRLPIQALTAQDLDRDGRCEDINGNGRKDFADVTGLFDDLTTPSAQEAVSALDFNGNRRLDFADVVALFRLVTSR